MKECIRDHSADTSTVTFGGGVVPGSVLGTGPNKTKDKLGVPDGRGPCVRLRWADQSVTGSNIWSKRKRVLAVAEEEVGHGNEFLAGTF